MLEAGSGGTPPCGGGGGVGVLGAVGDRKVDRVAGGHAWRRDAVSGGVAVGRGLLSTKAGPCRPGCTGLKSIPRIHDHLAPLNVASWGHRARGP